MSEDYLSEMEEAEIVNKINNMTSDLKKTASFKTKLIIYEKLKQSGIPKEHINKIIGKLKIIVADSQFDTPIFSATLDRFVFIISSGYFAYKNHFCEEAFFDFLQTPYSIPFIMLDKKEEGQ